MAADGIDSQKRLGATGASAFAGYTKLDFLWSVTRAEFRSEKRTGNSIHARKESFCFHCGSAGTAKTAFHGLPLPRAGGDGHTV